MDLEKLRNAATEVIGIDQVGRQQMMSPVVGCVPQNITDVSVNNLRQLGVAGTMKN